MYRRHQNDPTPRQYLAPGTPGERVADALRTGDRALLGSMANKPPDTDDGNEHFQTIVPLGYNNSDYQPTQLTKTLSNNRTTTLTKLYRVRDAIAYDLDTLRSIKERAPLYNRLLDVLDRIEILSGGKKPPKDLVDEIAARRTARRSAAATAANKARTASDN